MERDMIINRPVDVVVPNIIDLHAVLEYAIQLKKLGHICRILIFSSVTVYQNHTEKDIVVKETDANTAQSLDHPMVCYSESKRMCEVLAQSYVKQYGVEVVIARFSTVYGPTKNVPNTAFYDFIKKALAGEDIMLNGVGLPRRDNIYVDDAVSGLLTIAVKGESGEAYNISSNCELDNFMAVDEIAQTVQIIAAKEFGKEISVIIPPFKERQPGVLMDNTKLSQLGWKIKTSISDGVFLTMTSLLN
jgi:nucleoside-diphosphate-sugar epimerase